MLKIDDFIWVLYHFELYEEKDDHSLQAQTGYMNTL